jgi:hypothetical protein
MTLELRCTLCRNVVDAEDLFCANCGREAPRPEGAARPPALEQGLTGFDCRGCGASTTWDPGTKALRCAFCGSADLAQQAAPTGRVEPARLLPFRVPHEEAEKRFRTWIGTGFWRPRGIAKEARLVSMQAVFIPCWRFAAAAETNWTADSSATPAGARADWCPLGGRSEGEIDGVLVLASGSLAPDEIEGLLPYDLAAAEPYRRTALGAVPVEDFGVSRRGARPEARRGIEAAEVDRCAAFVPGRARNVHVNVLVRDLTSEPVLLPVWINAYRWKERVFRFLVNGQTGAIVGQAPRSVVKALLLLLAFALVVAAIFLLRG